MSKEKINKTIKEKIKLICIKIEQILKEYNESKEKDHNLKQTQDIYNSNSGSKINVIKNLKQNVSLIQNNLDKIYDINKINKIESEIKKKISVINQLSKEQTLLNDLIKKQQVSIDDYSSKFTTNKEISEIRNKLKFAKEENHMNREAFKLLNSKIKGQLSKIDVLDKKAKIIRQNIEFQQKKQKKEVEKSMNGGENDEEFEENGENGGNQDDLDCLMVTEKMLMLEIEDEEKNFKYEINQQNEYISQLLNRINEIRNKKNEIKLKLKENEIDKKIKLNKEKNKNNNKKNMNKNVNKKNLNIKNNNINYKSNDYQKKIYNTNKMIYKIGDSPRNKNEIININIYTNNKSSSKPFDIKKFKLINNNDTTEKIILDINNNFSNGKIYSSIYKFNNNDINENKNDNNKKINKHISPLKEIEQLQNEIKYALKNNVVHKENEEIENNEININNYKSNNDNNIVRIIQKSEINNKKNKPFEKFNFN